MSGTATMRAMIELGLSDQQKLVLIAAIEEDRGPAKTAAAERQRRYRERKKEDVTRDVTNDVTRYVTPPPSPNKSPPDPQKLTPTPVATRRVISARVRLAPPDGVTAEQWAGFLALRAAKRQPMTDRGYSLLCRKLIGLAEHGFPPGEMIDLAIERGWTTVHEPKDMPPNEHSRQPDSLRGTGADPLVDAYRAACQEVRAEQGQKSDPGAWPEIPASRIGRA